MVQDADKWQALLNTVMNLRVPQNTGNFLTTDEVLASQGQWTMYLFLEWQIRHVSRNYMNTQH
jgi:hypothetical protein